MNNFEYGQSLIEYRIAIKMKMSIFLYRMFRMVFNIESWLLLD